MLRNYNRKYSKDNIIYISMAVIINNELIRKSIMLSRIGAGFKLPAIRVLTKLKNPIAVFARFYQTGLKASGEELNAAAKELKVAHEAARNNAIKLQASADAAAREAEKYEMLYKQVSSAANGLTEIDSKASTVEAGSNATNLADRLKLWKMPYRYTAPESDSSAENSSTSGYSSSFRSLGG
jgi:hypothetical protein